MPRWFNPPMIVYHGTDSRSLAPEPRHGAPAGFQVDLQLCRSLTDFGRGFYTTTNQHQAEQWANARVLRLPGSVAAKAVVLSFAIDRGQVAGLDTLAFVRPTGGLLIKAG